MDPERVSQVSIDLLEAREPPPSRNRLETGDGFPDSVPLEGTGNGGAGDGEDHADSTGDGLEEAAAAAEPAGQQASRGPEVPVGDDSAAAGRGAAGRAPAGSRLLAGALAQVQRVLSWFLGDEATEWLRRPVELRLSTLIMCTLALITTLALVGIYLKTPEPEDKMARNFLSSGEFLSAGERESWPQRPFFGPGPEGLEARSRSRPAAAGGSPPSGPAGELPEFRRIQTSPPANQGGDGEVQGSAGSAAPVVDPEDMVWIKVRSCMDKEECIKLIDFLKTRVQPYVEKQEGRSADSIAGKEIKGVDKSKRGSLDWRVYVGPFDGWSNAETACEAFKDLTKRRAFVFNNQGEYFSTAYACTGPSSS
jgi:hypothetical protein